MATPAQIDLRSPAEVPAAQRARLFLEDLRGLLLGFDGDAADRERLLVAWLAARGELGGQPVAGEPELLTVFADLSELSRNRPGNDYRRTGPASWCLQCASATVTSRASMSSGRSVTDGFQARLKRMLGHYGVAVSTPRLSSRRRYSGSSWPSSG